MKLFRNVIAVVSAMAMTTVVAYADTCVKITANYGEDSTLAGVSIEEVEKTSVTENPSVDGSTKVMYWDSFGAMVPVEPEVISDPTVTIGDGVTWNAEDFTAGTYTETLEDNGLTIGAGAETDDSGKNTQSVTVDLSNATLDGITHTQRIKTGGSGDPKTGIRVFSFVPDVECTMYLSATSSNTGAVREVAVKQCNTVQTIQVSDKDVYTVTNLQANKKVQIYSQAGGLNVYAIRLAAGTITITPSPEPTATPEATETPAPLTAQTEAHSWTFDTDATYTGTVNMDNMYIVASADKQMTSDTSGKTVDGVTYPGRLKLGGTGSTEGRCVTFIPGSAGTVTIAFASSSSTAERTLVVKQGESEQTASATSAIASTFTVTANEQVYIYSQISGINIYGITYTPDGSSSVTPAPTATAAPQVTAQPQEEAVTWTFEDLDALVQAGGTAATNDKGNDIVNIDGTILYNNLVIAATSKTMTADPSSKTFDSVKRTYRLKLAGTGSSEGQNVSMIPARAGTVTIEAAHGSSTGDARSIVLCQGGTETSVSYDASEAKTATFDVAASETVYIYAQGGGMNLYAVTYTPAE